MEIRMLWVIKCEESKHGTQTVSYCTNTLDKHTPIQHHHQHTHMYIYIYITANGITKPHTHQLCSKDG